MRKNNGAKEGSLDSKDYTDDAPVAGWLVVLGSLRPLRRGMLAHFGLQLVKISATIQYY